MSKPEKKPILSPETKKVLIRSFLRSLPGLPGAEIYDLINDLKGSRTSIDEKIAKANQSLQETSQLIQELEQDLLSRTEKLTSLRGEVERYSKLAEVEENKAKALLQQVEVTLNKGRNVERWVSLLINLVAGIIIFVLGVLLGPAISRWLGMGR